MNCPFCAEEIKDAAVVCIHCGRDLSITKAVYQELRAAFDQIAQLRADVERLTASLGTGAPFVAAVEAVEQTPSASPSRPSLFVLFAALVAPLVTLVATYLIVEYAINVRPWMLRLALIGVAVVAALFHPRALSRRWYLPVIWSAVLGVLGVLSMDVANKIISGNAVFTTAAMFLNDLSFMASISLSFLTGVLLRQLVRPDKVEHGGTATSMVITIVGRIGGGVRHMEDFEKHARTAQTYVQTLMLLGTAGTALYAGLHKIIN